MDLQRLNDNDAALHAECACEEHTTKMLARIAELRRLHAWCLEKFGKAPPLPPDLDAREREVLEWRQAMRDMFAARADAIDER